MHDGAYLMLKKSTVALKCCIDVCTANRSQGTGAQRAKAWESWWSEQRPSHFNAMLARDRRKAAQAQREEVQRESDAQRSARPAHDSTIPVAAVRAELCAGRVRVRVSVGVRVCRHISVAAAWHRGKSRCRRTAARHRSLFAEQRFAAAVRRLARTGRCCSSAISQEAGCWSAFDRS